MWEFNQTVYQGKAWILEQLSQTLAENKNTAGNKDTDQPAHYQLSPPLWWYGGASVSGTGSSKIWKGEINADRNIHFFTDDVFVRGALYISER